MPYNGLMIEWENILPGAALDCGQVAEIGWRGEDLLVFRTAAGDCYALNAYCPHMGNYMPNGLAADQAVSALLRDDDIHCPYHGWNFDGQGRCTHIPPGQRVPPAVRAGQRVIRSWPVRERDGQIQIAPPESGPTRD